jgi:hypothetical protein
MRTRRRAIVCDVAGLAPTVAAIDRLARIQLEARRAGAEVQLRNLSPELEELLGFAGLSEALPVEVRRQPEKREQRVGVEEEGELGDPPGCPGQRDASVQGPARSSTPQARQLNDIHGRHGHLGIRGDQESLKV